MVLMSTLLACRLQGHTPCQPERAELRVCAVLAMALDGGRALRLSLPQELPERLPMARLAAASPA